MATNVDYWEVFREGDVIVFRFLDVFGDGEQIRLPAEDARAFLLAGLAKC